MRTTHGIVPALDVKSMDDVKRIVEATTRVEGVVAYKLGLTITLGLGLRAAVQALRAVTHLPILYDHQKAGPDVPDMAPKFCATCKDAGVDGLILFPLAGPRAVDEFVGHSYRQGLLPVVGGDLPLPDYNAKGGGYVIDDALDRIFRRAIEGGADHFIVPGNTPDKVRHHAQWLVGTVKTPHLFIPGIGALGGSVAETFEVAAGCRTYAVIGRGIYADSDPAEAARRFAGQALQFA
ncbi:MAG: orotidine 5-phosphate decarboxylase [Gammaproteobacteria bacterium]|nr:orotidine 5-phosphate decarboxylase [Gammaproteobacteria bacterium]NIR82915.1 orotidine 5-phosphate decarboxylase [Gammaproteobacteria bacterium]NIR90184.1 orotidine 5-phosphate decarboxylase [Gammaproteobacteria bacterium]NIU04061.1 orotidine 5-phosphate decarboxylase [Gammaproteobacteria bacterium]NIV51050.1 orotidine 5-phosphate decarboxylase [Gammaproteobacteria bacterium]